MFPMHPGWTFAAFRSENEHGMEILGGVAFELVFKDTALEYTRPVSVTKVTIYRTYSSLN